ncbi:MAG: peroxide stress protein YaaA [Pseudomonadota bacterium]
MLAVLSPAKALDWTPPESQVAGTEPALMDDARVLMRTTRGLTQKRIRELMNLSAELAKLNYERYHSFELPFTDDNALPASLAFNGDVYRGLDARTLDADDLNWAQEHLAILSGLFGILRPLDRIQPYRLEMGTRLKTRRGANLYAFWGDRIAKSIRQRLADHDDGTLVNLASNEYFKAVQAKNLKAPVIECVFEDWKVRPDEGTVIGFLAKYARGLMARHIVTERIDRAEGLKDFNRERYAYQPERSTPTRWVFARKFVPVGTAP